ncbi:MAG: lysophospholipid acyltransferase family protein [Rubritalea sp.]|uniref:lysophospholipid acyltransferase family protein n=1 Tax=Rubritalea sp. TaxID=2109375 RepID=UPI0032423F3F
MADHHEIRGDKKQRFIGRIAGWVLRIVGATLRVDIEDKAGLSESTENPVIWAFWHNTVFVLPYMRVKYYSHRKVVVLTSASKDGAVLESAVAVCDIGAVRGSSSRRAVAALIALRKAIQSGNDVCITPDGPRGPRYGLQPGIIKIAESTGAPIVPVRVEFDRCWKLGTWDAFRLPVPFSRVSVIFEEPIKVVAGIDAEGFEKVRAEIEATMQVGLDDI